MSSFSPVFDLRDNRDYLNWQAPKISQKELSAMFGVEDLIKTRFAQKMMAEGELQNKLKTAPRLLARVFSVEEVAEIWELDIEQVRQADQNNSNQ